MLVYPLRQLGYHPGTGWAGEVPQGMPVDWETHGWCVDGATQSIGRVINVCSRVYGVQLLQQGLTDHPEVRIRWRQENSRMADLLFRLRAGEYVAAPWVDQTHHAAAFSSIEIYGPTETLHDAALGRGDFPNDPGWTATIGLLEMPDLSDRASNGRLEFTEHEAAATFTPVAMGSELHQQAIPGLATVPARGMRQLMLEALGDSSEDINDLALVTILEHHASGHRRYAMRAGALLPYSWRNSFCVPLSGLQDSVSVCCHRDPLAAQGMAVYNAKLRLTPTPAPLIWSPVSTGSWRPYGATESPAGAIICPGGFIPSNYGYGWTRNNDGADNLRISWWGLHQTGHITFDPRVTRAARSTLSTVGPGAEVTNSFGLNPSDAVVFSGVAVTNAVDASDFQAGTNQVVN